MENSENFLESINSKSLFENQKTIIIKRATDKLLNLIEKININLLEDTLIIIFA